MFSKGHFCPDVLCVIPTVESHANCRQGPRYSGFLYSWFVLVLSFELVDVAFSCLTQLIIRISLSPPFKGGRNGWQFAGIAVATGHTEGLLLRT